MEVAADFDGRTLNPKQLPDDHRAVRTQRYCERSRAFMLSYREEPILRCMTESPLGREDDLDDHNYQVREVYAQYGLSSYLGQVMEKGLVNLLALHANVQLPNPTSNSFDNFFEKFAGYTLGRLIMAVEKAFPAETQTIVALRRALPIRNALAHDFFWDRAEQFMGSSHLRV